MQIAKVQTSSGEQKIGLVEDDRVSFLLPQKAKGIRDLCDFLYAPDSQALIKNSIDSTAMTVLVADLQFLAPIDRQEIWAAGVTYKRSRQARMEESEGAAVFYDLVYEAERPELFFKATPHRIAGPGDKVRIRSDSRWSVPEPELALVLSPQLELVGFTIGNDMSARDIEGENPLYLPQAKVYDKSCAIGPVVTLTGGMPPPEETEIQLTIQRQNEVVFAASTKVSQLKRSFVDLIHWLGRENSFPDGVVLLTGTGIVPPDEFSLRQGDWIAIDITGIGTLTNLVE